jgi:hypothetical protein
LEERVGAQQGGKCAQRLDLFLFAPLQDAKFIESLQGKFAPRSVNTSINNALAAISHSLAEVDGCLFIWGLPDGFAGAVVYVADPFFALRESFSFFEAVSAHTLPPG